MAQRFPALLAMPTIRGPLFEKPRLNNPSLSAIERIRLLDQFGLAEQQ
jgi:hypothetical protein